MPHRGAERGETLAGALNPMKGRDMQGSENALGQARVRGGGRATGWRVAGWAISAGCGATGGERRESYLMGF